MIFAKFENEKLIICPRNGYVGNVAISNLPTYLANHPEAAEVEGWKQIIYMDEPPNNPVYVEKDGVIYEKEGG